MWRVVRSRSPSSRRPTKRRRSSITQLAFHGMYTSPRKKCRERCRPILSGPRASPNSRRHLTLLVPTFGPFHPPSIWTQASACHVVNAFFMPFPPWCARTQRRLRLSPLALPISGDAPAVGATVTMRVSSSGDARRPRRAFHHEIAPAGLGRSGRAWLVS
jgi:hypothetical protein